MNTKRSILFLVVVFMISIFSTQYVRSNTVYVHSNDAVTAELMRQREEHERRYPSQDYSLELIRNLYDTNKFFYKLPAVQKQLEYLLELYSDGIEKSEALVVLSQTSAYHYKRYFLGLLYLAIGLAAGRQLVKYYKDISPEDNPFLVLATFVLAPIVSIVSIQESFNQFKKTSRWCANRLQKDQEIYALLLKGAKTIKS